MTGMRIDYTLVSEDLITNQGGLEIARVEVIGRGPEMEKFFSSDHCPILLELRPKANSTNHAQAAATASSSSSASSGPEVIDVDGDGGKSGI